MPYKDKEERRRYLREWNRRRKQQRRQEWLQTNGPCTQCGSWEDLEVDHIDRATKQYQPSQVWSRKKEIRESELAKCQALCKICHKAKTDRENTYRAFERPTCSKGHVYAIVGIRRGTKGYRKCAECGRIAARSRYARKKAALRRQPYGSAVAFDGDRAPCPRFPGTAGRRGERYAE